MHRSDLAYNPRFEAATEAVLGEAERAGELILALDEERIVETIHAVIAKSGFVASGYRQQKYAEVAAAERIGQHAQNRNLL
jgi:hypothetical protein